MLQGRYSSIFQHHVLSLSLFFMLAAGRNFYRGGSGRQKQHVLSSNDRQSGIEGSAFCTQQQCSWL